VPLVGQTGLISFGNELTDNKHQVVIYKVGAKVRSPTAILYNVGLRTLAPTLYHLKVCKKKQFDLHYSMAIE